MKIFYTLVLFLSITCTFGQYKSTSIGLRTGGVSGISLKMIDYDNQAVELILGSQRGGARFTGIYQKFIPKLTDRLNRFFAFSGIGAHAGYVRIYEDKYYDYTDPDFYKKKYRAYSRIYPVIGMDLIFGAEYHFESVPINISLDYKPYFEFFGGRPFRLDLWDIAFSIRYIIKSN